MDIQRHTVLRDWIALVLILVVVPLSVFGGTNIACVGQGISAGLRARRPSSSRRCC